MTFLWYKSYIIQKSLLDISSASLDDIDLENGIEIPKDAKDQQKMLERMRKDMFAHAAKREFEEAAAIRDQIIKIEEVLLKV